MKVHLVLPVTLIVSVALLGLMKLRKKEEAKEEKRNRFQDIKLRVTYDVLNEYQDEKAETQNRLAKTEAEQKKLEDAFNMVRTKRDKAKGDVDICKGSQKSGNDELAAAETELNNLQAKNEKEKASWSTEVTTLQQKLAARSSVCDVVKPGSESIRNLCGGVIPEAPKQEAPKPEQPKAEAPKPEAPKQEAPKAEAPKPEAPKQDAPKPEAPKPEAPKQDAPKPEDPKPEAPKQDAPKQDAPKPEAPKQR